MSYLLGLESQSQNSESASRTSVSVLHSGSSVPRDLETWRFLSTECCRTNLILFLVLHKVWRCSHKHSLRRSPGSLWSEKQHHDGKWRHQSSPCPGPGLPVGKLLHRSNHIEINLDAKQTWLLITTLLENTKTAGERKMRSGVQPLFAWQIIQAVWEKILHFSFLLFLPFYTFAQEMFVPSAVRLWVCVRAVTASAPACQRL